MTFFSDLFVLGGSRKLRNDETIISSISVTDIVFDDQLGKWNYRAIPKVKTWSYFLTIPKFSWVTIIKSSFKKIRINSGIYGNV